MDAPTQISFASLAISLLSFFVSGVTFWLNCISKIAY